MGNGCNFRMLNRDNSYCKNNLGKYAQKGATPWNKGKKLSDEHRRKLSESHIGKDLSHLSKFQWRKGHISWNNGLKGENSHSYGKVFSKERRDKISKALKDKPLSIECRKKISEAHKGLRHTKQTAGKISQTWKTPAYQIFAKERRAKQILPKSNSLIEVKVQVFLKELGVDFIAHCYMDIEHAYQCDAFIPLLNVVIECDGDYWHKYPIGRNLDHVRTQELAEKGFKVLRLWEKEIKTMGIKEFEGKLLGGCPS